MGSLGRRPARVKRTLARVALGLSGIVLPVLMTECALRMSPAPKHADVTFNATDNSAQGMYSPDPELLHKPTAGFTGTVDSLGYSVDIRVNQHSLRGPEVGEKAGERWLAAGDSFTFAAQVNEPQSFVGLLNTPDREVLNAGADGYGTWQALRRYEALDDELALDGVLLVFFVGNDLHDNSYFHHALKQPRPDDVGPKAKSSWLQKNSVLWARWQIRMRADALKDPNNPERQRWTNELRLFMADDQGARQALLPSSEQALRELRDAVRARGDKLLVAVAPPAFQVQPERVEATFALVGLDPEAAKVDAPSDAIHSVLRRLTVDSCDLVQPLREQAEGAYFEYDGHWTPHGHAIVADTINGCF
jgi:hypothetical protein